MSSSRNKTRDSFNIDRFQMEHVQEHMQFIQPTAGWTNILVMCTREYCLMLLVRPDSYCHCKFRHHNVSFKYVYIVFDETCIFE